MNSSSHFLEMKTQAGGSLTLPTRLMDTQLPTARQVSTSVQVHGSYNDPHPQLGHFLPQPLATCQKSHTASLHRITLSLRE